MVDIKDLENVSLFKGLDTKGLQKIAKICKEQIFKTGDIVLSQGSIRKELNILIQGKLEVAADIPELEDSISICNLTPKDIFGEISFIDGYPCSASVKCSGYVRIATLNKDDFDKLVETNPRIESIVIRNLAVLLAQRTRNTTAKFRDEISGLFFRRVSKKMRSSVSNLAKWVNEMNPPY